METRTKTRPMLKALSYFLVFRSLSVFMIFLLLGILFTLLSPEHRFSEKENLEVLLALGSEFNIIALAVGMLMICGEFDLSVGSILVFCSFVFLKLSNLAIHALWVALITIALGSLIGFLHGFITVKTGIPSFITTLGAMLFWRGLTIFLSEGLTAPLDISKYTLFIDVLTGTIKGVVPVQFLWFVGIAVVLWLVVHSHRFGNWIFTTGDNRLAAKAMGINTDRVKLISFALLGLICGFVAVMQIVRVGIFTSRAGDGWELRAIAASVVGGTALTGGVGSIAGVFWGAMIVSVIENGLVVLRIPYAWTYTIFGIVLVASVILSLFIERKRLTAGSDR